jgi:DNA-binding MarR family transcriptional regulator
MTRDGELVLMLCNLQTKLLKQLDHSLSMHGISFTEFHVMFHLSNSASGSMRRIDLAESVGLSASGVTRLLNPMQKIGLVEKEESARDARVSLVGLTDSGRTVFSDAKKTFEQSAESFLKTLSKKQRTAFASLAEELL